jgi:AcrR family transcriptional regulator
MVVSRAYRQRARAESTARTRERIMGAVRELLEEGTFHQASVEEIAERAGVARATLYQHFGSRFGLVDAICDSFADNPSLMGIKGSPDVEDAAAALVGLTRDAVGFWASEESLHRHLYGLAAIDDAAADFVRRQRADRRSDVEAAVRRAGRAGLLRDGLSPRGALARMLVITSFETFEELRRHAGLPLREVAAVLEEQARALLRA